MKRYSVALTPNLAVSLVMALAYSGLVATLVALHPGPTPTAPLIVARPAPADASPVHLPKVAAPGSLRLRMTLPYMPGNPAREADQEI